MKAKAVFKTIGMFFKKNAPTILTVASVVTSTGAVIATVPATIKTVRAVDNWREFEANGQKPTFKLVVKLGWKYFIIPVALEGAAIACAICSNVESSKRIAALAAAALASEEKLDNVRKELLDKLGVEKASDLLAGADQKEADKHEWHEPENGFAYRDDIPENVPEKFKPLWFDEKSGRYFRANQTEVDAAVNKINSIILEMDTATVNDLYFELGLKDTKDGAMFGWNNYYNKMQVVKPDEYVTCPTNGEPAKVLSYNCAYLYEH